MADNQLTVIKDGETHILDISKIAYIETVDRRTFVYTEKLCNDIVMINEGKIVEHGSPREICRRYNHQRMLKIHLSDGSDIQLAHNENAIKKFAEIIYSQKISDLINGIGVSEASAKSIIVIAVNLMICT